MTFLQKKVPAALALLFLVAGIVIAGGQQQAVTSSRSAPVAPIHILISSSPWLGSFQKLVTLYEKTTGDKVVLDVTPFPAMLQKTRNAITAPTSEYDVVGLTEGWIVQFYRGGLLTPLNQIDPSFTLSRQVIQYGYADRWDASAATTAKTGELYGVPINGNIQLLFYRKDLFAKKNLAPPQTFAQLLADAKALADPPKMYGFTARTSDDPEFNLMAFIHGYGGSIASYDRQTGKWSVNIDKKPALEALKFWLNLAWNFDPSNYTGITQATMISLMASGKSAMTIMVDAAVSNLNNPNDSSVIGKIGAAVTPGLTPALRAPSSGIWVLSIPNNLPLSRKKAAFAFISWAVRKQPELAYAEADGIPVREDVYRAMAKNAKFWWAPAIAESTPYLHHFPRVIPDGAMKFMLDDVLRQVVAKQVTPQAGMKEAASNIYGDMKKAGYPMEPLGN